LALLVSIGGRVPFCPACGNETSPEARFCVGCGAALDDASTPTRTSFQPASAPPPSSSPSLPAAGARFLPGATLAGRYRIVGPLGRGGMGEVYRADDLKLGQPVALKFLPRELERDASRLERLLNEVKLARQVAHPNVCRVYDVAEVDGHHFLSMEYVDGEDLASLLRRIGRLPQDKAAQISRQLCAGLAAAHEQGILHRDLKPANVMIDGRGRAKITDFGLAQLAGGDEAAGVIAGTPGYMAPEQATGGELTPRSDLYALGLVLYELFTGKRVFDAKTPAELIRQQRESTPTSPTTLVSGLDETVERAILRCLEKDPANRPASALAVAASLPGGDPLAAALAAGETPSPELVAEAGEAGGLRPVVAWSLLAGVLVLAAIVTAVSDRIHLLRIAPMETPPQVLVQRAREIIADLGHTAPRQHSVHGYFLNGGYLNHLGESEPETAWERLDEEQPGAFRFWYRQSPRYMKGLANQWVNWGDPPLRVPGMVRLLLDPQGRLRYFAAVPPDFVEPTAEAVPPVWDGLFAAAGFDIGAFEPAEPAWQPFVYGDVRAAWEGTWPGAPDLPIRIEAASFRGQPVYLRIVETWSRPFPIEPEEQTPRQRIVQLGGTVFYVLALGVGVVFARRNLRLKRADSKSALRIALFLLSLRLLIWLVDADHIPRGEELDNFQVALAFSCYYFALVWVYYMALEPYLRRLWPRFLVSWVRLLDGRFRDPLVGRDVLIGCLVGWAVALWLQLYAFFPQWLGFSPPDPGAVTFGADPPAASLPSAIRLLLFTVKNAVQNWLQYLVILLILRLILRNAWLAIGVFAIIASVLFADQGVHPVVDLARSFVFSLIFLGALLRFGLLAPMVAIFVMSLTNGFPIVPDFSAWYVGQALLVHAILGGMALYGFRVALAGRPMFADATLGESSWRHR
jgi:serine/threonine-protein kinase